MSQNEFSPENMKNVLCNDGHWSVFHFFSCSFSHNAECGVGRGKKEAHPSHFLSLREDGTLLAPPR